MVRVTSPHVDLDFDIFRLAQYGNVSPLSDSGSPVVQITLAGHTWNLYTGWNNAWTPPQRVYSFVSAEGPITSFSGDLMEFFRYLIDEWAFPAENQYMLSTSSLIYA
jgi:xyloglucan-specific endo-beta-1,4-glucanase